MKETLKRQSRLIDLCGGLVLILVALVTLGWVLDIPMLTRGKAIFPPMMPNTAIGLSLMAASLLFERRGTGFAKELARVLAAMAAGIGALTLFQYLAGVNLGIDTLLLP